MTPQSTETYLAETHLAPMADVRLASRSALPVWLAIAVVGVSSALASVAAGGEPISVAGHEREVVDFDAVDHLPDGWLAEGTNQQGAVASWSVRKTKSAASPPHVLALIDPKLGFGGTFNLFWTEALAFLEGTIETKVRALTGGIDQGGGIAWRIRDAKNYYVCRANPLENNLRVYYVLNGKRSLLDTADVEIPAETWHTIRIEHKGDRIACYLNGLKLLEVTDATLPHSGGVGFWAKADAISYFDDLVIERVATKASTLTKGAASGTNKWQRVSELSATARVSLAKAIDRAQRATGGKAIEARYEMLDDALIVSVRVVVAGRCRVVHIDSARGRIVSMSDCDG